MLIYTFKINQEDDGQVREPTWKIDNTEPGEHLSNPFIFISNGEMGVGLKFQSQEDVDHFKQEVERLEYMTPEIHTEFVSKLESIGKHI